MRLRHQGFVRTTPDGQPVRLTCVTRLSDSAASARDADLSAVFAAQSETLRTLSNELSTPLGAGLAAAAPPDLASMVRALTQRSEAIERGVDDLAHARHAAESANLAKSQFLANMSHELRTPLNAIIGYAEMLQEDAEDNADDRAVQDLNRILAAAKHLLSLINEILDLSKIEAGRMDVDAGAFDPHEMLDDVIDNHAPAGRAERQRHRHGQRDRPTGRPTPTRTKLRQCVLNLLSNACKFTRNGRIDVGLRAPPA